MPTITPRNQQLWRLLLASGAPTTAVGAVEVPAELLLYIARAANITTDAALAWIVTELEKEALDADPTE